MNSQKAKQPLKMRASSAACRKRVATGKKRVPFSATSIERPWAIRGCAKSKDAR